MDVLYATHPEDSKHYTTEELRNNYLLEHIFAPDEISLTYVMEERIIIGGAMPVGKALSLDAGEALKSDYFLERREMGVINIGGDGAINIDGKEYEMKQRDGIYIGKGNKEITFSSKSAENPAKFYIASTPAHSAYETVKINIEQANHIDAGSEKTMNKRTLNQYLIPGVCKTCQLSMGLTQLEPNNGWNSMPCHTHERRSEVYLYFDLPADAIAFHFMGRPQETRHIVMKNEQAVVSPSWSIHCGVGTSNYAFIWAMCGENQDFSDMDGIPNIELK